MRKRKLLALMQFIAAIVLLLAYAVCSAAAMNFYYDRQDKQPHVAHLNSAVNDVGVSDSPSRTMRAPRGMLASTASDAASSSSGAT